MNELLTFDGGVFSNVRIVKDGGCKWYVANDICDALGIKRGRNAMARLDDDEHTTVTVETSGGKQKVNAVSEAGVYRLILGSRKEFSQKYQRWIAHDVLPTISRDGRYELRLNERIDGLERMLKESGIVKPYINPSYTFENLKTRFISFFSPESKTPSSLPTSKNVFISSSVNETLLLSFFMPKSERQKREIAVKIATNGVMTKTSALMIPLTAKAKLSGYRVVMHFGVISPKTRSKSVTTPVAAATPALPKSSNASIVMMTESAMLTSSFETRSVFKSRSLSSSSLEVRIARLLPLSRKKRTRSLFDARNALSLAENKADKRTKIIADMIKRAIVLFV